MKKLTVTLSLILSLILCIPSIPVLADNQVILYCSESISNFFDGTYGTLEHDREYYANQMYPFSNTFSYNDYNYQNLYESLPSGFLNGTSVLLSTRGGSHLADISSAIRGYTFTHTSDIILVVGEYQSNRQMYAYSLDPFSFDSYVCSPSAGSFSFSYVSTTTANSISVAGFNGFYFAPLQGNLTSTDLYNAFYGFMFVSDDIGVYSYDEARVNYSNNFPYYVASDVLSNNNSEGYTNFHPDNLPYWNGTSIVDPDEETVESNLNHLYFNSCEVGFAEPYGVTNFATYGGAYFYVKYKVDDWILDHINDYDLYFSSTGYVGSRQYNGSKRISLDADGCITIPFSDIFTTDGGVVSNGFVSAVSSKVVDQRFYKTYLYSIAGEKLQNFVDQQNTVSGSFSSAWDDLVHTVRETYFFVYNGPNDFSEVIQDVVQSQIVSLSTVYKNYKINVNLYLVDNNGNRSGSIGRLFDLYTGSDTSTDNQGLENQNPYIDDSEDYLPDLPDDTQQVIQTTGNGSSVNVYNMTPSEIKLIIDNGFERFVSWYNSDPSTAEVSTGFWNSFGIFRNNPAIDLYEEYFGFLPTGFKDIILGCATIGIVGGVFCAIRRKLT